MNALELVGVETVLEVDSHVGLAGLFAVAMFMSQFVTFGASVESRGCSGPRQNDGVVKGFGLDGVEHGGVNLL